MPKWQLINVRLCHRPSDCIPFRLSRLSRLHLYFIHFIALCTEWMGNTKRHELYKKNTTGKGNGMALGSFTLYLDLPNLQALNRKKNCFPSSISPFLSLSGGRPWF